MQNANRSLTSMGKKMQNVGSTLSIGLTAPLLGIAGLAVKAAASFETLQTSLDTVFKGDSNAANKAFSDIKAFAGDTPFQLEEVANSFIKLKNLGLDPSIESLTSYGNTASALGKSLDQMIEAVADASVGEFERLKEFGIKAKSEGDNVSFTFQGVTTTVKKSSEDIQNYLLNIGNTNFAGSIERQAQTFTGKLSTLKDNISQAFAGIGSIIIEYITPLFNHINSLILKFNDLSPSTKKFIVILGGIAAAIGPLLALAGTILPAVGAGFALLTGPIGLVIAALTAIGIIIYKNWEPIKKTLVDIANYFVDLYNESTLFRIGVEAVVHVFKTLFEVGKFAFEALKSLSSAFVDSFSSGFKTVGKIIKAVFTGNLDEIPSIIKQAAGESVTNFSALTSNLADDWSGLMAGITTTTNDALANITQRKKLAYVKENVDASGITDAVAEATQLGLNAGGNTPTGNGVGGDASADFGTSLNTLDTSAITQGLTDLGINYSEILAESSLSSGISEAVAADFEKLNENFENQALEYEAKAQRLQDISSAVGSSVGDAFQSLSTSLVSSLKLADTGFQGFIKSLLGTITKLISMMLAQSIANSIAGATSSGSATGPAAVFTTPAFIATAVGGVLAAFAAIPKFETGGVVGGSSFYGDKILARVNSGELILNQKQQGTLLDMLKPGISASDFETTTEQKLRGEDIILITTRAQKKIDRSS